MQAKQVLAKVYEPGRLQRAWQQVKRNAGAAGIDRMTVEEFAQREEVLLTLIHDKRKLNELLLQASQAGTHPQRRDIQEEEAGDIGGNGSERRREYA